MSAMSIRQTLHDYIDTLSDEEVISLLGRIEWDEPAERVPLTPEQIESVRRGLAQLDRGEGIPHEEAMRRIGRR
jgi:hypothetical protein